jgi:hypothetical protein
VKDRSAPFSKKHRRYWLPVTGGMILIGMINVALGYCSWPDTPFDRVPERIIPVLPISQFARPDAGPDAGPDGGSLDAAQDAPAGAAPAAPRVPAAAPASSAPAPR